MNLLELKTRIIEGSVDIYKPESLEGSLLQVEELIRRFGPYRRVGFYEMLSLLRHA